MTDVLSPGAHFSFVSSITWEQYLFFYHIPNKNQEYHSLYSGPSDFKVIALNHPLDDLIRNMATL